VSRPKRSGQYSGAAVKISTGAQAFRAQLVVPEQRQLYDYWAELAGSNAIPERSQFAPARLPRLLPGISLIEVHPDIKHCRIRLAGTRLREIYDREVTGMLVSEIPCANRQEYWLAAYSRTIEQATPTQGVVRGPMVNKDHVVQYWLKLPLRTSGPGVGIVLCYDHFVMASELFHDEEFRNSAVS
jgi:hypothetical protein